jgi:hypothetical protein
VQNVPLIKLVDLLPLTLKGPRAGLWVVIQSEFKKIGMPPRQGFEPKLRWSVVQFNPIENNIHH